MATIQVAVRCRPFSKADHLGVSFSQSGGDGPNPTGEISLLHSTYTTNRFGFTWAWWSAVNYRRYVDSADADAAEAMDLVDQATVYAQCGERIKRELLEGNAIVLFAYGLSGSGKTFTVFGPDAVDSVDAWFRHAEPHPMWGVFPRLIYQLFEMKSDGWKISMKYFQNVVDTVRDLMSPFGEEKLYKTGMRKDADGFMDIEWCMSKVCASWDDLRAEFMRANARKAISATQFNHQSTRGHCILVIEVEMPKPDDPNTKQRGRIYVCDLAGTEPAGDIYSAMYRRVTVDDGTVEHELVGPNPDQRKTKELQDQGKKINLSLSEMAMYFNKMAEAIKAKRLRPGRSIPGCNSYFLCKYLKDTMLQAKTYLFCAVRPEVFYHKYTYATLGFAKNASVIKLSPKKATTATSAAERKLMRELEQMKSLVSQLRRQNEELQDSEIEERLAAKQMELERVLGGGGGASEAEAHQLEQQREDYARRGIDLAHFSSGTPFPHFVNLDPDPFRDARFLYVLRRPLTAFGPGGDIKPTSFNVVKDHCAVEVDDRLLQVQEDGADDDGGEETPQEGNEAEEGGAGGADGAATEEQAEPAEGVDAAEGAAPAVVLIGGEGDTFHNGVKLKKDERRTLSHNDRVVIGGDLVVFQLPSVAESDVSLPLTAEEAIEEYQNGLRGAPADDEAAQKKLANDAVNAELLEMMMQTKQATRLAFLLDRDCLSFEPTIAGGEHDSVKVRVARSADAGATEESVVLDPFDFSKGLSVMRDELRRVSAAIDGNRSYECDEANDPLRVFFETTTCVAAARVFTDFCVYNLMPEDEEKVVELRQTVAPFSSMGQLEVSLRRGGPQGEGAGRRSAAARLTEPHPPPAASPPSLRRSSGSRCRARRTWTAPCPTRRSTTCSRKTRAIWSASRGPTASAFGRPRDSR